MYFRCNNLIVNAMSIEKNKYYDDVKNTLQAIKNMDVSISNLFFVWCGIENILTKMFLDTRSNYKVTELEKKKEIKISCSNKIDSYKIYEILFFIKENNVLSDNYIFSKLNENENKLIFTSAEINQLDTTKLKNGIDDITIINQFRDFRNQHLGHKIPLFEMNSSLSKIALVYKKTSIFFLNWFAEEFIKDDLWYNNINSQITSYSSDINYFINSILEEEREIANKIINDTITKINRPESLEILDETYFQNCVISDEKQLNSDKIAYYTKFNVPETRMGIIISNKFHIPPKFPMQILCEDEYGKEPLMVNDFESDILNNIDLSPVLYKVLSTGGAGKSTFIWFLAYTYYKRYPTFYINKHDVRSVKYIFDCVKPEKQTPIIIIMDEFTRSDISSIVDFSQAITNPQITKDYKIILILAEREVRFEKLDKDFYDGYKKIYTHTYSNVNIKDDIFDEVFKLAQGNNILNKSSNIYIDSKSIYNNTLSVSIVDRIFATLRYLKNKNLLDIKFKFDWDDWFDYCDYNKANDYQNIFNQVAFFYQFGIEVPLNYICKFLFGDLNERDFDRKLNNLIVFFESLPDNSSVNYNISKSGNTYFLRLRHEKIGQWFFEFDKSDGRSQQRLFESFIKYIDDASSFYLFKNLIRNNPEFENTDIYKSLSPVKIITILDGYINKSEDIDEKVRGLMERHFYYYNTGKYDLSLIDIKEIINLKNLISDNSKSYLTTAYLRHGILLEENRIEFDKDSEIDVNELAEQVYLDILKYDSNNIRALLKLYNLYYNYLHKIDEFIKIHQKLHYLIIHDVSLAYGLISFIKNNFDTLPEVIIPTLNEVSKLDVKLIVEISNLLDKYRLYQESDDLLTKLIENIEEINVKSSLYFANQVIDIILDRIYKIKAHNNYKNYLIDKADYLISEILKYKVSFKSEVLKAKISFIKNEFNGDYESLLFSLFEKDNSKYVSMNLIHTYYFVNINRYLNYKNNSYEQLGVYINSYTNFFIKRYDNIQLIPANQKIKDYLEYLRTINKTIQKISDYHKIINLHKLADEYFEKIECYFIEIKNAIDVSYYNYLFSKFATIHFFHYKTLFYKRILLESDGSSDYLLNKIKDIKSTLDEAFLNDRQNKILYIYLIECNLILNLNIDSLLSDNIIYSLSNDQKAELLKTLWLNVNYKSYAISYTEKFGFINSTKLKTKNNLVFSYINAGLWKNALSTLEINYISESDFLNSKELRTNIRELADKIVVNSNRKNPIKLVEEKLKLSNFYLNCINNIENDKINKNKTIYTGHDLNVTIYNKFKMLFLLGRIKEASDYFDNFSEFIIKSYEKRHLINGMMPRKQEIFKSWYIEYIDCHSQKIINEVRYNNNYSYLIEESKAAILNLLKLKIPYTKIIRSEDNNKYNTPDYFEKYNNTLKLIFNNFIFLYNPMLENKKRLRKIKPDELYDFYLLLLLKNNILIDKCILSNLIGLILEKYNLKIDSNNFIINELMERYKLSEDTEVFRMIGRYLLSINNFVKSQKYTEYALKLARTQSRYTQEAYCLNNLSECHLNYAKYEIQKITINENNINRIYNRIKYSLAAFYKAQSLMQKLSDEKEPEIYIKKNKDKFHAIYVDSVNTLILSSLNKIINVELKIFTKTPGVFIKSSELLKTIRNENIEFAKTNNINIQAEVNNINQASSDLYKIRLKPFFDSKKNKK